MGSPAETVLPVQLPAKDGLAHVFHRQDDTFRQPKAEIVVLLHSPFVTKDALSSVKADVWCQSVMEALNDYTYDATLAGVSYNLSVEESCIEIYAAGFDDKLSVLLSVVAAKMRSMTEVPEMIFQVVSDGYLDDLRNMALRARPISQMGRRFQELIKRGSGFPAEEKLKAAEALTAKDLNQVSSLILNECHMEVLALGNTTSEDAMEVASGLAKELGVKNTLKEVPLREELALPSGKTLWTLDSTDADDPNHAVSLAVQVPRTDLDHALLLVLCNILSPKFFDSLRTQQQLGYIVSLGAVPGHSFNYLKAQVQTEFPPAFALSCIDAFLTEQLLLVETALPDETFEMCRQGLVSELRSSPKNLHEEMGRYKKAVLNRTYDFAVRGRILASLETITVADLQAYVKGTVRSSPHMYMQVKKITQKEDKAVPGDASDIAEVTCPLNWVGVEAMREYAATAVSHPYNSKISAS